MAAVAQSRRITLVGIPSLLSPCLAASRAATRVLPSRTRAGLLAHTLRPVLPRARACCARARIPTRGFAACCAPCGASSARTLATCPAVPAPAPQDAPAQRGGDGDVEDFAVGRGGDSRDGDVLRLRNSLARSEVVGVPLVRGRPATWYSCGPTVYDASHVGHARTYVATDVLRRLLAHFLRVPVHFAMGLTDVDDKIIARAAERGVPPLELARSFEAEFWRDMDVLGVLRPTAVLRVSEHIDEIVDFVARLVDNGCAYQSPRSGSVYFRAESVPGYGTVLHPAGRRFADDDAGEGAGEYAGEEPSCGGAPERLSRRDFALWKRTPPGEIAWPSPWGAGRPGWHVECSAAAAAVFGRALDFHSGGIDLRFPHHENEIAQSRAYFFGAGCPAPAPAGAAGGPSSTSWPRVAFLHTGHVHVAGRKMSKSLKNFLTVREMLESGVTPNQFRLWCLLHRWDGPVDLGGFDLAADVEQRVAEVCRALARRAADAGADAAASADSETRALRGVGADPTAPPLRWSPAEADLFRAYTASVARVDRALCDNVDTPAALQEFLRFGRRVFTFPNCSCAAAMLFADALRWAQQLLLLLGLDNPVAHIGGALKPHIHAHGGGGGGGGGGDVVPAEGSLRLAEFRCAVRQIAVRTTPGPERSALLAECDRVRAELVEMGLDVRDEPAGAAAQKNVTRGDT